jgi:hypothetical protein
MSQPSRQNPRLLACKTSLGSSSSPSWASASGKFSTCARSSSASTSSIDVVHWLAYAIYRPMCMIVLPNINFSSNCKYQMGNPSKMSIVQARLLIGNFDCLPICRLTFTGLAAASHRNFT